MDIRDFSESLIGFQELAKDIFRTGKISSDIKIKITSVRKGSILVDTLFVAQQIHEVFKSLEDLLYFLQIVAPEYYLQFQHQLSAIWNDASQSWQSLEAFSRQNPFISWIVWAGTYDLIKTSFKAMGRYGLKNKKIESIPDNEQIDIGNGQKVPCGFLKQTKKIIESGKSLSFLEPIIEDKVSSIQIWTPEDFEEVQDTNLWNFIGEWQEILPGLKNGEVKIFKGSFTGMQSNNGETITFKSSEYRDKRNNYILFCCLLPRWKKTEDFKDFYGESKILKLNAEIYRSSVYKKPKFILLEVDIEQTTLDL